MDTLFVVTPTGLSANARRCCEAAVLALHGTWSGALVLGGPPFRRTTHLLVGGSADPSSGKVRAALGAGLPIVGESWLEASAEQGFFLDWKKFVAQLEPAHPLDLTATSTTVAGTPPGLCSPPERLREARPRTAATSPFVALPQSPERARLVKPKQAGPVLLQREIIEAPRSSPPVRHSPPALAWIPSPGVLADRSNNDQAAAAAAESVTAGVTPLSTASNGSSSGGGSGRSSSAKVMRFMSREPQVTLVRGGAVRRCISTPESGSWGGQECAGGSPAHGSRQSGAGTAAAAAASAASSSGSEGTLLGAMPQRLRYSFAARRLLPDTAIALGQMLPSHRRPSLARLEGLRQHHGLSSLTGVTFYASAQCALQGRRRLTLVAGEGVVVRQKRGQEFARARKEGIFGEESLDVDG